MTEDREFKPPKSIPDCRARLTPLKARQLGESVQLAGSLAR